MEVVDNESSGVVALESGVNTQLVVDDLSTIADESLNDTYGHPFGDTVLQTFGRLLADEAREADIPCRYGGEEFTVLIPSQ